MWTNNVSMWDDFLDPLKVTFDGARKEIVVNPGEPTVSVKADIYSAWKRWVARRYNSKYISAMRTIGGDPISDTLKAGDLYFLSNGWKVIINTVVAVEGALFTDDQSNPYVIRAGGVTSTVSNLVQTATTTNTVPVYSEPPSVSQIADQVWLQNQIPNPPTVNDIATEVWNNTEANKYTPEQIAAAVLAVLGATNLPVNVKQVNDILVTGTGTTNDPWGP